MARRRALLHAFLTYWRRHWRGELPLAASWWLNCVALTALSWWAARLAAAAGWPLHLETRPAYAGYLCVFAVIALAVPCWQVVGLWRSADRHIRSRGTLLAGRIHQALATLFMVLVATRALGFVGAEAGPARLAFGLPPYGHVLTLRPGGRELVLDGALSLGTAAQVAAELEREPGIRRLRLNSTAGNLIEAGRLRTLIEARQLMTYTTGRCAGPCVFAYLAGRHRYLHRRAALGFEWPGNVRADDPLAIAYREELRRLARRGLPPWFLEGWKRATRVTVYPPPVALWQAGIVNTFLGPPPG